MSASISAPPQVLLSLPNTWTAAQLFGTGPVSGLPYNFQIAELADPSATIAGGVYRQTMINTTLNYSASTTNIWEGLTVFATVNGPGVAEGEINGVHALLTVNSGATVQVAEGFESRIINNGTLNGGWTGYLATPVQLTGTAASGTIVGFLAYLTNSNVTAGSVQNFTAFAVDPMFGSGAPPTFNWAFRNNDPLAMFSTAGASIFGSNAPASSSVIVAVEGPDNSAGTSLIKAYNLAGTVGFNLTDALGGTLGGIAFDINGNITASRIDNGSTGLIVAHASAKLGFFDAAPVVKPTVTGSKGGNAALASLMTALSSLGIVTDTTS